MHHFLKQYGIFIKVVKNLRLNWVTNLTRCRLLPYLAIRIYF